MNKRLLGFAPLAALTLLLTPLPASAATTYYVSPSGSGTDCTQAKPCREISDALAKGTSGFTVEIANGNYHDIKISGKSNITLHAAGGKALIANSSDTAIRIDQSSNITLDGVGATKAGHMGLFATYADNLVVKNGWFGHNGATHPGVKGNSALLIAHSNDITVEHTVAFDSGEHGIYVSDSSKRPTLRGNLVYDNQASPIQLNSDKSGGGDGIISGATIELNVVYSNGSGGAGLNLMGVVDSIVRANAIFDIKAAGGISLSKGDGATGPSGIKVYGNTVVMSASGRYSLQVLDQTGSIEVRNNVLYSPSGSPLDIPSSKYVNRDYNVYHGTVPSGESHSKAADSLGDIFENPDVFTDPPGSADDPISTFDTKSLMIAEDSVAKGVGDNLGSFLPVDITGTPLPINGRWDIGAASFASVPSTGGNGTTSGGTGNGTGGGTTGSGNSTGSTNTGGTGSTTGGNGAGQTNGGTTGTNTNGSGSNTNTTPPTGRCADFNANTIFPLLPASIVQRADGTDGTGCTPPFWDLRVAMVIAFKLLGLLNWTAGTLAVVLTVYAGILYLMGFMNESNVGTAKKILIAAYVGLIIVFSARLIVFGLVEHITDTDVESAVDQATHDITQ